MRAQPTESDAGRAPAADGIARCLGEQDLAAVGRRADASHGIHGQPHVARVGEGRAPAVQPRAETDLDAVRPRPALHRALHPERGLEGGGRPLEDAEELVSARVDLASLAFLDRGADETAHLGEQRASLACAWTWPRSRSFSTASWTAAVTVRTRSGFASTARSWTRAVMGRPCRSSNVTARSPPSVGKVAGFPAPSR